MAELATIARPYARAAFRHALEAGSLPRWSLVLGTAAIVVADPAVEQAIMAPAQGRSGAAELVANLVKAAGQPVDQDVANFVALLGENHRLPV